MTSVFINTFGKSAFKYLLMEKGIVLRWTNRQIKNMRLWKLLLKKLKAGSDQHAGPEYEETVSQNTKSLV